MTGGLVTDLAWLLLGRRIDMALNPQREDAEARSPDERINWVSSSELRVSAPPR